MEGATKEVKLLNPTSLLNPSFYLKEYDQECNYVKWNNKYYYIKEATIQRNDYFQIDCEIDYLASYKNEILNTNSFVRFSTSTNNSYLIDPRLSSGVYNNRIYKTADLVPIDDTGTYIITYVTSDATYGLSGCVWLNEDGANLLAQKLSSTEFGDALENIKKTFQSAYDSVLDCKYVPIDLISNQGGQTKEIKLGDYGTQIFGIVPKQKVEYTTEIEVPHIYGDFRELKPYRRYLLYLCCYGYVEIDPLDLINRNSLNIKLVLDGITGEGIYYIDDLMKVNCNFSTSFAVGTISNPHLLTGSAMALGGAIALLNPTASLGAIAGGASALFGGITSASATSVGSSGSMGGLAEAKSHPINANLGQAMLVTIDNGTNVNPNTMTDLYGKPLNEVKRIGDLNGYCQTTNFSLDAPTSNEVINNVNDLMNGGIYIE